MGYALYVGLDPQDLLLYVHSSQVLHAPLTTPRGGRHVGPPSHGHGHHDGRGHVMGTWSVVTSIVKWYQPPVSHCTRSVSTDTHWW